MPLHLHQQSLSFKAAASRPLHPHFQPGYFTCVIKPSYILLSCAKLGSQNKSTAKKLAGQQRPATFNCGSTPAGPLVLATWQKRAAGQGPQERLEKCLRGHECIWRGLPWCYQPPHYISKTAINQKTIIDPSILILVLKRRDAHLPQLVVFWVCHHWSIGCLCIAMVFTHGLTACGWSLQVWSHMHGSNMVSPIFHQ